jgi:hypothetical protein
MKRTEPDTKPDADMAALEEQKMKRARLELELTDVKKAIAELEGVLGIVGVTCSQCGTKPVERVSTKEKSKGRAFWSCPQRCPGWIGWVDETAKQTQIVAPPKRAAVAPPPPTPVFKCFVCKEPLDIQAELDARDGSLDADDLKGLFATGDFVCVKCAGEHE